MASSKDLRRQHQEALDQFQSDVTASSITLDAPDESGLWWKVTMPLEEYESRIAEMRAMRRGAEQAEEAEALDLEIDCFLYESE